MRNLIILIFLCYCAASSAANSIFSKKEELTRVSTQIQKLQETLNLDQQEKFVLESSLENMEKNIGKLNEEIRNLNQQTKIEQQHIAQLEKNQQISIKKLNEQQAALTQQCRTAYQLRQSSPIKIILNNDNPNKLQRHLHYYHQLTESRLTLINNANYELNQLKNILSAISERQRNLKNLARKKQKQQNQLQTAQAHRQHLLTGVHKNVQNKQQKLATLINNQKTLQDIITRLSTDTQHVISGAAFKDLRGKLQWPTKGTILANFGSQLDVGDQHLAGTIIKAEQGAPVRAIYSGKVIFANWLRGFGLLIIINHGNNYMSLYGRNQALYTKVGSSIKTGDIIASAGSSGGYEKSGLYFEIRQNGIPVNPNLWCR